jgi:hypothetical protein
VGGLHHLILVVIEEESCCAISVCWVGTDLVYGNTIYYHGVVVACKGENSLIAKGVTAFLDNVSNNVAQYILCFEGN